MNLEHVVVPESKEMLETHTHTHTPRYKCFNKQINGGEERNLMCRIQNNLCRYIVLREVEIFPP